MKTAIVFWSGTGNTEAMAQAVAEGAKAEGATVDVMTCDKFNEIVIDAYDAPDDEAVVACKALGAALI